MSGSLPRPGPSASSGYAAALAALTDRGRFGIRLGLGRTRALLAALGNPERSVRGALVAGTNGKGSVIALASAALRAAGYRVAETPKPHLVTYRERIVVDGRPIDADAFTRLVFEVLPLADRVARRHGPPTEFELLTAVMFRYLAEVQPDIALVEVGLGGRLDATHAWDGGVAVVTNVDLDHTAQLGPTIEAIAREKAAIIERGDIAATGTTGAALAIVRRRARRLGVPLLEAADAPVLAVARDGITAALPSTGPTRVGLLGRHQAANAAVAEVLLDALEVAGLAVVPPAARRRGYGDARWPGRLEHIVLAGAHGPVEVLLDGAHNPAGARALATALDDLRPHLQGGSDTPRPPVTLVWATMADKDIPGTLAAAAAGDALRGARIIATSMDVPRALSAVELAAAWLDAVRTRDLGATVEVMEDPDAALDAAIADGRGPVVVAGSLYLVGAARARFVHDPLLADPSSGA